MLPWERGGAAGPAALLPCWLHGSSLPVTYCPFSFLVFFQASSLKPFSASVGEVVGSGGCARRAWRAFWLGSLPWLWIFSPIVDAQVVDLLIFYKFCESRCVGEQLQMFPPRASGLVLELEMRNSSALVMAAVFLQSTSCPPSLERGCSTRGVWEDSGLCTSQQISSIQEAAGREVTQAEGLKGGFTFWTSGSTEGFTLSLEGLQKATQCLSWPNPLPDASLQAWAWCWAPRGGRAALSSSGARWEGW